jgi:hypothetical protein
LFCDALLKVIGLIKFVNGAVVASDKSDIDAALRAQIVQICEGLQMLLIMTAKQK